MGGYIKCNYCNEIVSKSIYLNHVKRLHKEKYLGIEYKIIEMNNAGYTTIEISRKLNIDKNIILNKLINLRSENKKIKEPLDIYKWEPEDLKLETTTLWGFPERGDWATHSGSYRGNWSPYIPRNIILRYSRKNDIVLDQFLGGGTTLIETKLLQRKGVGVDINKEAINISKENVRFKKYGDYSPEIIHGDARNLNFINDNTIDLICTHPPYANIIKYSKNNKRDLSILNLNQFIEEMGKVANESYRVLKNNKYCAILIGDIRRNKHMIPLGFRIMQKFLKAGFVLKETIIKEQHNCKGTGFWYKKSIEYNFLLIAHEYLFIFRKP